MAWSLIPIYSRSYEASSKKKIFTKWEYLVGIEVGALFATNAAIYTLQERWISLSWILLGLSREVMWTTKISYPGSRAVATNSFFSTSLTCLVIEKTFSMI